MTSYISGLLRNLSLPDGSGSAIAKENTGNPSINYITMYSPELVSSKAETFEELHKMIIFFADPSNQIDKHTQLSLVGLIRGSCSLANEFNPRSGPTTVSVEGGAIVVVEVEKGFFIACSVSLPTDSSSQRRLVEIQIERLLQRFHEYFRLLHSSTETIFSGEVKEQQSQLLKEFYLELIDNYNEAVLTRRLKRALSWPNSLCYQGLFSFFPNGSYKKSSVRVPDSQRPDLEALWEKSAVKPAASFVAHIDKTIPKREGLIYRNPGKIEDSALLEVYRLLEFFSYHDALDAERLGSRRVFKNFFSGSSEERLPSPEVPEPEALPASLQLTPSTAFQLLHPASLAQTLVVSPLSTTLDGIKFLGSTVNEQLPSASWIPFRRAAEPQPEPEVPEVPETASSVTSSLSNKGTFVMGPDKEDNIYSFLVYLPVTSNGSRTVQEFSVVVYVEDNIMLSLVFESSAQELTDPSFFHSLRFDVCEPAIEIINDCIALTAGGMTLNSSISSLPNPVSNIISGKNGENADIDSDFFFIIYDTKEKSFQSSLPWLPQSQLPSDVGTEVAQVSYHYQNAFFYLHDQLADYFVMRSAGNILHDGGVREHLHKFTTNKNNDWLMYFMRHRHKSIVIIRNYNAKHKQKPKIIPKEVREASEANSWTSSVYDYAHLGFLDSLGDDVKVWLGNLRSTPEE
ncbi:hypothetical protein FT663_00839 [Candidozyma haemuli var. vulneris]|uniref:CCZ1/INTU/HSP4 first Longin domain-containing protein n=1 Tax=Candidozyma haemuli TaxID=45357 RepID=A0A2V1AX67_9ASCO|nr:hypothetical protein CXQ85_004608 [[Candida] haemuloni]KAF3986244.1 hypothetical protein FT662_04683 [[Candida] haemuloni var. vulneris]KAF3995003.1 hypothetical protein FT663_00839 [[Candida] haemuloni var. vulneris]PVH21943.1 hypothetical protein CXQ85_004608 [[Candida] haemuloni]